MKKITIVIASMMLGLAITATSCGNGSSSESTAADSDTIVAAAVEVNPNEEMLSICREGIERVNATATMEELAAAVAATTNKIEAWSRANPGITQPTPEMEAAVDSFEMAFKNRRSQLEDGLNTVTTTVIDKVDVMEVPAK